MQYRAPRWLPGGHAQTIWPALFSRQHDGEPPSWTRERWDTPDGDFIDVDFLAGAPAGAPLLVLFHGLEGDRTSHSSVAFASAARARGWAMALPHFRGCSGELNRGPRAYHSGDYEEVGWILQRLRARHGALLMVAGVSLGGNALMRWAEEAGQAAAQVARAVGSVCSPIDLAAAGAAIDRGFNRQVYARRFLRTMIPKALSKLQQHPGLFDGERLKRATTLYEFDNLFTAPLHGFRNTEDYWTRAAAKPHLYRIRIPALVLNALNDPFVPRGSLPHAAEVGPHVTLWQPGHGGHVGFPAGRPPGHLLTMPEQVCDWLWTQR
ncbi:alpha/beta fold hydrolase [Roseateles sp.]|uniref:YheT family hydrolase n=1 Tax=Roseateles sp. TaxID=1971397 RepID=UPI0025D90A24|nr:alpha/beta fold hydrolase [Roseateles sp.]MBV8036483.1 alpha/beta fold hydrolase [Roseateles sp.]